MAGDSIKLESRKIKEMARTQQPSGNTFIFWKTEYRVRKVIIIPTELREKKVKVRTKVVEGDVPRIIGKFWMEE